MSLIYFVTCVALTMKRVYHDQVMVLNGIFPILDASKVKLKL